jgi:predicted  nucleic acid-binding Zn-ribbon protein
MALNISNLGLTPTGYDKHGPMFSKKEVDLVAAKLINTDSFFYTKGKNMTTDLNKATELLDDSVERFTIALNKFNNLESKFKDDSKKVSSSVKDAEEKLIQGISRVEKAANFERLERYVILLERASQSMMQLAELQKDGRLEKIANAIK